VLVGAATVAFALDRRAAFLGAVMAWVFIKTEF
jgi:hypothetical protein